MGTTLGGFTGAHSRWLVLWILATGLPIGCTREYYRRDADSETYQILAEKTDDPDWAIPRTSIDPPPQSRLFDPFNPDYPPLPPDDPAAHGYMHCVDGMKGYKRWAQDGLAPWIEDPGWRNYLELSEDGSLALSPTRAVQLGLLDSRQYQTQLENLYLSALALTLERFEFDLQWFGRNSTFYDHVGENARRRGPASERNNLTTLSNFGFSRAFSTGGQLLVDFANTFVWEFTGTNTHSASSNIAIGLMQPLLRGAGREVRLESLTQAERDVLYAVRDFARFRKQFYFDIVAGSGGFLSLLFQLQGIRNLEANLVSLEQNLREHEALAEANIVSRIQVDQVFQSYQAGQLALIQAQNDLETALDTYKIGLGLPPALPARLDDSLLNPFQLTDPALNALQGEVDQFLASYRELSLRCREPDSDADAPHPNCACAPIEGIRPGDSRNS